MAPSRVGWRFNVDPERPVAVGSYKDMAAVASEVMAEFKHGTVTLTKLGSSTPGENPRPLLRRDRSTAWLKIKCVQRQEFVVIGWGPPGCGVDNVRGPFIVTYGDGQLVYRGGVGTGSTDKMRRETWEVLQIIRLVSPLGVKGMPRAEARGCRWV